MSDLHSYSTRQVVLDTETTGLDVSRGHRIIEIGCVELIDRKLTGHYFHRYFNPEREVDQGALAVHGLSNEFLKDKPLFRESVKELMIFLGEDRLIIHNAPFDLSFLNNELILSGQDFSPIKADQRIIDTLLLARKKHVGQRNNLDALCKRYKIDYSKRDVHGALLDARLLAQVFLAMTSGQASLFDSGEEQAAMAAQVYLLPTSSALPERLGSVLKSTKEEEAEHRKYLEYLESQGSCLWQEESMSD